MMSNVTTTFDGSSVPNPFDPLVFLLPEVASHIMIVRYICTETAGVSWLVSCNLQVDCAKWILGIYLGQSDEHG